MLSNLQLYDRPYWPIYFITTPPEPDARSGYADNSPFAKGNPHLTFSWEEFCSLWKATHSVWSALNSIAGWVENGNSFFLRNGQKRMGSPVLIHHEPVRRRGRNSLPQIEREWARPFDLLRKTVWGCQSRSREVFSNRKMSLKEAKGRRSGFYPFRI